jgi:hypothetical protein
MPGHVLGAAARACEPGARAASVPGRQPPVRRRGRGASPGAGRRHRPPNPAAQGPSWTPRATPSPTQLLTGPRGPTVANTPASGPSDRAAGLRQPAGASLGCSLGAWIVCPFGPLSVGARLAPSSVICCVRASAVIMSHVSQCHRLFDHRVGVGRHTYPPRPPHPT